MRHAVCGAAIFERAGDLAVLELEENAAAGQLRKRRGLDEIRAPDASANRRCCALDILDVDQALRFRFGPSGDGNRQPPPGIPCSCQPATL